MSSTSQALSRSQSSGPMRSGLPVTRPAEPTRSAGGSDRRTKILILDDSPTVVAMLSRILRSRGHEVIEPDLAVLLPELLRESRPDLIIVDLEMPHLRGEKLTQLIRRLEDTRIPIVVFSGSGVANLRDVGAGLQTDAWLEKCSPPSHLLQVVDQTLAEGRRHRPAGARDGKR